MTDPESDQPKKQGSFKPVPYGRDISFITVEDLRAFVFGWECPCCGDPCPETIYGVGSSYEEKVRITEDARCLECRLTKSRTTRSDQQTGPDADIRAPDWLFTQGADK